MDLPISAAASVAVSHLTFGGLYGVRLGRGMVLRNSGNVHQVLFHISFEQKVKALFPQPTPGAVHSLVQPASHFK
jgi:hypothetical protein